MKKFNFLENLLRREFAMSGMRGLREMNGLRAEAVNSDSQPTVNRQSRLTSVQCHYSVTSARVAREWLKYAAMFVMLFTFGVGNAWGGNNTPAPAGTYNLVTDASTLAAGDVIIITGTASSGSGYAISTTQNTNNRGQASVTISNNAITIPANNTTVQGITLEAGTTSGTLSFKVGDNGYLYAASSSSNYLKTESTKTANSSWTISISSNNATVTAQGSNSRKLMRHNSGSSLFACYATNTSTGTAVRIFKKSATASHTLSSAVSPDGGGTVTLGATSVAEGSTTTATATPAAHYTFTSWSISGTGASLSSTMTNPTTVTMGTTNATITATFTAVPKASITLSEAGSTTTDATTYYVGDTYTLPSTSASCGTKVLVGWSTVAINTPQDTKPASNYYEKGAKVTLAATQTFYAVFATASSGGSSSGSKTLVSKSSSTYYTTGDITGVAGTNSASWTADEFTMVQYKNASSNAVPLSYDEIRAYQYHSLVFTPTSGTTITSIVVTANSDSYATALGGSSISNCTKSVSSSTVTITPTDGTAAITLVQAAQSRLNKIVVNYTTGGGTTYSAYATSGCSGPSITVDPTSLTDMGYLVDHGPGTAQSFTVTAANLSGNLTVKGTDNYEICLTNSGTASDWKSGSTTLSIAKATAEGAGQTVYVRLKSDKSVGNYNSNTIKVYGGGIDEEDATTVTVSGSVVNGDLFKTALHTSTYSSYASGVVQSGTYEIPSLADVSKVTGSCEGLHYHFAGWVADAYKSDPTGHIIEATGSQTADNTTYWAVWEQEGDGGNTLTKLGKSYAPAAKDNIVIVAIDGSDAYALYQETYSTNYVKNWSFVNNVSNVSASAKNYVTLTSDGASGWYLGDATNGYIYNSSSNDLAVNASNKTSFTIEWNDTENKFTIIGNSRWLSCRTDLTGDNDNKYRMGGATTGDPSGTAYFDLYKYVGTVYEDPVAVCSSTCATPTSPTNTSISTYSATIGWTGGGTGDLSKYEYALWIDGETEPTSGYVDNGSNTSKALTGLLSNTTYRWKVRKVCSGGAGESTWLRSYFTTSRIASITLSVPSGATVTPTSQASNVELPAASVPTNGADCWEFAGWTTAAYTGSSAPAKFFEDGYVPHLAEADGTTLRAVYVSKPQYRIISQLSEISADEYYVLTFDRTGVSVAMSATVTGTYFTTATSINIKTDDSGPVIENPDAGIIWKFTGTTSSGNFYNENSDKYIDLHDDEAAPVATTTTDNVNITVVNSSKKQFDIESNTTNGNYLQLYEVGWGVDDEHDGYFSCRIFKRSPEATYTTAPPCASYTVTFDVNGDTHDTKSVTECAGFLSELPDDPGDDALDCANVFMGWSAEELTGTGNDEPGDLFYTLDGAPEITEDTKFYAVFATETDGTPVDVPFTFTIDAGDFNGTSYDANNNEKTTTATATDESDYTMDVKWTSHQVMLQSSAMQWKKNEGYIYNSTDLGTITSIDITSSAGTFTTYYGTSSEPSSGSSGTGKGYFKTSVGNAVGTTSKVVVNFTKTITPKIYTDYVTYCTNVYNDATNDHKWSTTGNWSNGHVPTINERATINKPVTVDMEVPTAAKAKNVVIYNDGSTHTGQLVIDAGKELVVAETVRKTTNGSTYAATGENDIVINSTSGAGLGALAIGSHATANDLNNATVNFTTKSNGSTTSQSTANASDAQYVGTPFSNSPKMLYQFYNSWMYKFVNPGEPGWTRVDGEDGLTAFKGYCVFSADGTNHTYWMQGTLVASEDQENIALQFNGGTASDAKNENMLANSWMAPIKIAAFDAENDFTNANATIYIYNTGSPDDFSTNGSSTGDLTGQYKTYTPGTAGTAIIPSMQAFSVYTSGSSPKITLNYKRLVYDPAAAGSVAPGPNKAPKRAGASEDEADKMRLFVRAENGYGDMLYMWEREDFEEGFENGWDGRKMFGADVAPQLYAVTTDGNMAINCVPDWEGTVLGFKKGTEDNVYTFTFEYEGENTWYLNDLREQTSTLISSESSYMFMASDEDMVARFIISRTPIHSTPTGIEQSAISGQQSAVKKIVIDDHVYIIRNGKMYSAEGVMVR